MSKHKLPVTPGKTITIGNLEIMTTDLGRMDWQKAMDACEALGNGWRLPNKEELNMLYQNKDNIGGFANHPLSGYWSSTHHGVIVSTGDDDGRRWYQMLNNGDQFTLDVDSENYVRAVRMASPASL